MSADLDRFDRMLLATAMPASSASPALSSPRVAVAVLPAVRQPVIHSTRGPRYVDHMTCPMCGADREGIEYHGELMSGAKVHTIQAHTAGMRRVQRGEPRCLGAAMRVVFTSSGWLGAPT